VYNSAFDLLLKGSTLHRIPIFLKEFTPDLFHIFKNGYKKEYFSGDLFGGITVAIVALPLAMAFAIASGVGPEKGIITAIIAGAIASMLGGSRVQISGPTGAFVVVLYDIVLRHGYEGLALATIMAGFILILMAIFKLGAVIKYIPYPVVTGFTSGIALIIFTSQVADLLGLGLTNLPADFISKWEVILSNTDKINISAFFIGVVCIALIILTKKYTPKIPGPIVAVIFGALIVQLTNLPVETIQSRFGEIPNTIPPPNFYFDITLEKIRQLIPDATTIALLAAIESLLCAVVADGMIGSKHNSNSELLGQGVANIGSVIFGGIPATGAIARTATNIKSGAKTPISGVIHAILLCAFMFYLSDFIILIPMSALAAILVVVSWNMSEAENFKHLLKAPRSDVAVLFTTFFLTVIIDLTVAVQVGIILAAVLFIKRIISVTDIKDNKRDVFELDSTLEEVYDPDNIKNKRVPDGIEVYEIDGPFFFGVADRLKYVLDSISLPPRIFILRMRKVPFIDATGMYALKEFYIKCAQNGTILLLSGVRESLHNDLDKFGFCDIVGRDRIFSHIDEALKEGERLIKN